MIGMTAKYELENCYDIKLDTADKLLALKTMMEDVDNELIRNTSRRYRIPLLAIRQTLDECFEILEARFEGWNDCIDEILGEEE